MRQTAQSHISRRQQMPERLKVMELTAQNIMKVRYAHIKPNGEPVVVIGGNNAEGKSSLMNAFLIGLRGKRDWVKMPISKGEQAGAVRIGLGRKGEKLLYIITQKINPDSLKIERMDGQPLGNGTPRAVLDAKLGPLAFDPMALMRMDAEDQAKLVRQVYGIDTDAIDVEYSVVYEDRRQANSSLKAQKTILDEYALMDFSKLPAEPIDVGAAMQELNKINQRTSVEESNHRERQQNVVDAKGSLEEAKTAVATTESELEIARATVDGWIHTLEVSIADVTNKEKELKTATEADVGLNV